MIIFTSRHALGVAVFFLLLTTRHSITELFFLGWQPTEDVNVSVLLLLLPRGTVCLIHSKTLLCHCLVFTITAWHFSPVVTKTFTTSDVVKVGRVPAALHFAGYTGQEDTDWSLLESYWGQSDHQYGTLFIRCCLSCRWPKLALWWGVSRPVLACEM